ENAPRFLGDPSLCRHWASLLRKCVFSPAPCAQAERRKPNGDIASARTSHGDRRARALPLVCVRVTPVDITVGFDSTSRRRWRLWMSDAKRLQKTIRQLMESQPDDSRLRDHLEGLTRDLAFPDLTWFWGPLLYKRNRAMFRSMILNHFSEWQVGTLRWKHIAWADHAEELEAWLADARSNRDSTLVRRLLSWKFSTKKG